MHLLFVSIAFPPKQDPECLQTAKYFKYIVGEGIDVSVVTSAVPTLNMTYDASLEKYDKGYVQKLEYQLKENKYLNFLIRKISPATLTTPDSKKKFVRNWQQVVQDLKKKPDLIYSRSFPLSSALTALKLKKVYNVPWVMHLSDPWADAPWTPANPKIYRMNKELEQECFSAADRICFTTDKTLAFYSRLYPVHEKKFELYPNVFDGDDVSTENPLLPSSDKLRIVYTGGMTGNRGPIHIINVLEHLRQKGFDVDAKMELVLAGDADRYNRGILEQHAHPYLNYVGRKTYAEAKSLQKSAHLLLIIEEPQEDVSKMMFFPSKILDYMVAKKKMFALTGVNSQVDITFKKMGWESFDHGNLEATANFLEHSYSQITTPGYFVQNDLPPYFDAKENAQRLVNLMRSL